MPSLLASLTFSGERSSAFIQGNAAKIIKPNFILLVVSKEIDSHRITLTKVSKCLYMELFSEHLLCQQYFFALSFALKSVCTYVELHIPKLQL